ncbi:cell division protein SepF [Corynebacterium caspium]|uniref:cell division protein SepF n=1 Tax=Corynebacterium caspium TaxID=234828 RepID=UPI00036C80DC|nr:cell division protein SepF [Corynebacterium caspium]WKD59002.1 Cell division protein SepF [Corynebacterium caspium DSM 44850]
MSIIRNAKEFFGLAPFDEEHDEFSPEHTRYETSGSAAYQPRTYDSYAEPAMDHRGYSAEPRRYATPSAAAPIIETVHLNSYREAREIGIPFRSGNAVILDLSTMPAEEAKRVIDFSAGLCFALRGQMEKLSGRIFALIPQDAPFGRTELERAARLR